MAPKKKAAQAGDRASAAAKTVRENPYLQRLMDDPELRDNLRSAFDSAKKAYTRMNGKGPVKAVTEDKKTQREIKDAASSLKDAMRGFQASKKKTFSVGRLLLLAVVGGIVALVVSEGLRKKVLDALFGAEEEFEYTASTTPATGSGDSPSSSETVEQGTT